VREFVEARVELGSGRVAALDRAVVDDLAVRVRVAEEAQLPRTTGRADLTVRFRK
jgi:hypothetical protein